MKRATVLLLLFSLAVVITVGVAAKSSDAADRDELLRLDREFDQKVAAGGGGAAWASYFAENGSMVGQTGAPVVGPEAIRARMEPVFANPDFSLRWQPTRAEILIPGHVGYTTGRYERRAKNKEGKVEVEHGTYVSVWRKQADGSWKIILDTGNADPAEAAKAK
jgi:uncharacterized protein (TIGR02246 family)